MQFEVDFEMDLFWTGMMLSVSFSLEVAMFIPSFESNNPVPVREESLILSCFPTAVFNTGAIVWYHPNGTVLARCLPIRGGICDNNITYTANITGSYAFINSLNRTRDSGIWECGYTSGVRLNLTIIVYASPVDVKLTPSSLPVTDLGMGSLTLKCQTVSCTYPAPKITWYIYNMTSAQMAPYTGSSNILVSDINLCVEQEAIYTNTLHLPHGTAFQGNIPVTTTFLCGLEHPTLGQTVKYSQTSNNVTFAVNLTYIQLKDVIGTELLGSVEVVQGTQDTFVCITSVSRPTATVNWYIEDTQINDYITSRNETGDYGMQFVKSRLTFVPSDMEHHNKRMYCRAFSYNNSIVITSSEALLFVKVNVTQAEIQQSNHTVALILNATSWEPVTLTCLTAFSRPAPTIDWYIESQWKGNGTSLTFTAGNEGHNKTIYCKAYNIDPSRPISSRKPRLYVKVPVSAITLENSTTGTFVFYDGFSQKLKCTSSPSRPSATIKWMLESQTESVQLTDNITNTDVINIHGLYIRTSEITLILKKENRNQKIFCIGNIDGQQTTVVSSKVTVDVWYQPNKPNVQEYGVNFPWLENQNGTLKCNSSDYGNPTSNVSWTSNRGITDANGHLVIIGLASSDDRNLVSCELVNRYTIDKDMHAVSESIDLNVEYTPEITFVPSQTSVTIIEARDLLVTCYSRGNPPPTVEWLNKSQLSDILYIQNVRRHESGTYICRANSRSTNYGRIPLQIQKQLNLTVQFAPEIAVKVTPSILEVNSEVRIECTAHGEPSIYKFYDWIHKLGNIKVRHIKGILVNQSTLGISFPGITIADMGTYVCLVDNGIIGPDGGIVQSMEAHINVIGVPVAFVTDTAFIGETNMSASIRIPFFSNPSMTGLKFFKTWNNAPIANDTDTQLYHTEANISTVFHNTDVVLQGMEAVLHFRSLKESDFGQYTLVLSNNKGTATIIVHLKALELHTYADIGPSIAGIAGGIGGGVVLIVVTGGVIWLWRRHNQTNKAADGTACVPTAENYEALQAKNNEGSLYQELSDIKSCADTEKSFRMNGIKSTENQPTYINTKETGCVPQDEENF